MRRDTRRPRPFGLLAELTHRCPLKCPYGSNPTSLAPAAAELTAADWDRVFAEAADLGVLQVHLSGGEPLLRSDLADIVRSARTAWLYTNLVTSGIGLSPRTAEGLRAAGLQAVQLSFQADVAEIADPIAGAEVHPPKVAAARLIKRMEWPLTVNVVLHLGNIDRTDRLVVFAEALGAGRLELANVQFYGWAFQNRGALLPTREQSESAGRAAAVATARLRGRMQVVYVLPDYFGDRPKPCMQGWGRRSLTVNPAGDVLPCPAAGDISSMRFENVRGRPLGRIWSESDAFNRFRGTDWMPEPCRSCDRREIDFGGCRCQAARLTGDPTATDPACALSPHRSALEQALTGSRVPLTVRAPAPP